MYFMDKYIYIWASQVALVVKKESESEVAQSCSTLCDPVDCSPPGSSWQWDSPGKSTGVGCQFLLQGNLSDTGIKPRSPALQADALTSEPPGKQYIMRNAGLEEAQAGIKIARRNLNNLRYADNTTLMAEGEEELKSFLIKVSSW